jgi:hypothetical protein
MFTKGNLMALYNSLLIQAQPGPTGTSVVTIDARGAVVVSPARHLQDGNVLHDKVMVPVFLGATSTSYFAFGPITEGRWQLDKVSEYHQTGSTSGTMSVTVDTGTQAPGAGTAQLTATLSLAAATQQIVQNGAVIASPTVAGPGDRFSILIAGTMTNLASCTALVSIKRIS